MNAHVSITPTQASLIAAHKARQARFAAAARKVAVRRPANTNEPVKLERQILTPVDFIKAKCAERGITYEHLISREKTDELVSIRNPLVKETKEMFPKLSLTTLGRLFNREHTTILYILGHLPGKRENMALMAERDRQAKALYLDGKTLDAIAIELNVCLSTVKAIKRRCKWDVRAKPKPPRSEKPHERRARELYASGMSLRAVSDQLGMDKESIRRMRIRWNWPERSKA
ncbi:hypothetical protein ACFFP0_24650 [Rhizobium puerariae]|uniref:Helix-turn-helix domain-containing protein n=1 Tax=Rhizobium puerariae TaxID=1585791 RepID=A0ABV6AN56_9HYPH